MLQSIIYFLLWLYTLIILGRFVIEMITVFVPDWQPGAFIVTLANVLYALTDPPLNLLRRLIPPVQVGRISLDMGLLILLLIMGLLQRLVQVIF